MIRPLNTVIPRRYLVTALFTMLGCVTACMAAEKPLLVDAGSFIHIYDPSVGEKEKWYSNDHCFVQGTDGLWHLFGITHQEPASPLQERALAHATARTLLQRPWDKQRPALTYAPEPPWNEEHLWAPHVTHHDGQYFMFFCAGDRDHSRYKVHLATSVDLRSWTRHPKSPVVVDGFDVFVSHDPFHWIVGDKVGHIPAHAAEVVRDQDGGWFVSRCGWGRGGVYLAPLTWHDGLENAETNMRVSIGAETAPNLPAKGAHR